MQTSTLIFPIIVMSVLAILLVVILMVVLRHWKKMMDEFTVSLKSDFNNYKSELMKQNDILARQVLEVQDEKEKITTNNNKSEETLINTFVKISGAIKESCIASMNEIKAARLAIYLFHNGVQSTHGINFLKVSCICEKIAVGSGVRERMIEHTGIPINLFDEMIDKMILNDRYIIINDEALQKSNHRIFVSSDKITYTQLVTIYDINNNMLGFVAAEMKHIYSKDAADKEKACLDSLVKQLVPILSYSEYVTIGTR